MAVRQYVGARYVPQFADPVEWSNQVTYEPLTIVTYLGASYTSKKAVPAGTLPTDTEYWAVTGNYNAQVEAYRQEVLDLSENLNTTNDNLNEISDIVSQTYPSNPFYLFVGDSYASGTSGQIGIFTHLVNLFKTTDENSYYTYKGGAGFVSSTQGKNFYNLVSDVPLEIKNKVTHIIIITAGNDFSSSFDTIQNAMNNLWDYIENNFPNHKLTKLFAPLSFRSYNGNKRVLKRVLSTTVRKKFKFCKESFLFMTYSPYILSDNVHLTTQGYSIIANGIYNDMFGLTTPVIINNVYKIISHDGINLAFNSWPFYTGIGWELAGSITVSNGSIPVLATLDNSINTLLQADGNFGLVSLSSEDGENSITAYLVIDPSTLEIKLNTSTSVISNKKYIVYGNGNVF